MRKVFVVAVVALASVGFASAASLEVGSTSMEAKPDQQILIVARGNELVGGVEMRVQIGDGGADNLPAGDDVAGMNVPALQTINYRANNAIWGADEALTEEPGVLTPLLAFGGFALNSGNKSLSNFPTGGVVGTLILDGTGVPIGTKFMVSFAPFGEAASLGSIATQLIPGEITVVPEPASLLMLLALAPMIRRRR
jgi:hypothetical protein